MKADLTVHMHSEHSFLVFYHKNGQDLKRLIACAWLLVYLNTPNLCSIFHFV